MTIVYFYLASGKMYHGLPVKKEIDQYHFVDGRKKESDIKKYCKDYALQFNHYIFGTDIICKAQVIKGRRLSECQQKKIVTPVFDIFAEVKK